MITYVPQHDGIYLGTIVQESHATFPIYLHLSYILNPVPSLGGVQIQEGSLWGGFYASWVSFWGLLAAFIVVRGIQAPLVSAIPSFLFNCFLSLVVFTSGQLWMKSLGLLQW